MSTQLRNIIPFIPIFGISTYICIYLVAIQSYPGGSINDLTTIGYSHFHNFLCDVNHKITTSGLLNQGRPLAILAHLFLSVGMTCFFYMLPEVFKHQNRNTQLTRSIGTFTFMCFTLMFTEYHDYIVFTTGVLGTLAMIPFFIELKNYNNRPFIFITYISFIIGIIVFLMYFSKIGYYYLPFIEKIAFVIYTIWVIWVSFIVAENRKTNFT